MKLSTSFLGLFAAATMFVGCKDTNNAPAENSAATETAATTTTPKTKTASFTINGMSCALGCSKAIESKVAKLDGVQEAKVDFETKRATIKFDPSKQTPETIIIAVEAVADGKTYTVTNMKSTGDQAMAYGDPKKEKKKKKSKKAAAEEKAAAADAKPEGKPACCASKKSCSTEEKKVL
ncbi:MAG TPA: heavy metal-associated domain-containing protein [Flavobacterium sp.]|jgi:copper chaperone CopZ